DFSVTVTNGLPGALGLKHRSGAGNWGIELTSVRWDRFIDPTIGPNPCFGSPGCRRESAPSACVSAGTDDVSSAALDVHILKDAPGAQYYNVYVNPNGCDGLQDNFAFVNRFLAPGWNDFGGPPPAGLLSQENGAFSLQYPPYTGGDVANENYCQVSPIPGNPSSPCATAKITPGAVQFYFPNGSCFDQNAQGATYVYSGEQYNWISIYSPPANTCNNTMNGGASTQFIGTIYTPGANWSISGGDRSPLAGQVICYTA